MQNKLILGILTLSLLTSLSCKNNFDQENTKTSNMKTNLPCDDCEIIDFELRKKHIVGTWEFEIDEKVKSGQDIEYNFMGEVNIVENLTSKLIISMPIYLKNKKIININCQLRIGMNWKNKDLIQIKPETINNCNCKANALSSTLTKPEIKVTEDYFDMCKLEDLILEPLKFNSFKKNQIEFEFKDYNLGNKTKLTLMRK